jgi:hypothetical protein
MSEQIVTDSFAAGAQFSNGVAEIDRIPKDNGRDDQVEARCSIALIFERPVADFAKAMKEHRPGEGIARLTLVEAYICSPPESRVTDPVEGEEGPFKSSYFSKGFRQRILFGVSGEPAHQDRRRDGSSFD